MNRCKALALGWAACLLAGCGFTDAERTTVGRFAEATVVFSESAQDALVRMREDTIALTGAVIELGNPNDADVNANDLDRALDPADMAARVVALRALRDYGALLHALTTDDAEARIGASASRLRASLGVLEEQGRLDLSPRQRGAIGELLASLGQGLAGTTKVRAVREVVPTTAPAVERLTQLVIADFDEGEGGFASQVLVARSDAQTAARLVELNLGPLEGDAASGPLRRRIAEIYALAGAAGQRVETTHASVREAARALREANSNLKTSVDSGGRLTIDRLEQYIIRVRELVTLVEIVAGEDTP